MTTPTRHDSAPSPLSQLPTELLYHCFRLAASLDPHTARSLAYVSRTVCHWTISQRWSTIVCTTPQQVVALWLFLIESQHNDDTDAHPHPPPSGSGSGAPPTPRYISCPASRPGSYTRNLFIDTTPCGATTHVDPGTTTPYEDLLTLSSRLQLQRERDALAHAAALSTSQPPPAWETLQRTKLAPTRASSRLSGLLYHFPALDHLALGATEMQLFQPSLISTSPVEMMLVYDGNDTLISDVFLSGVEELAHWSDDVESSGSQRGAGNMTATLGGIRRRLKRLHVVGIDPRSQLAGVAMPVKILEPLRAGSTSPGSLIHALSYNAPPLLDEATSNGDQTNGDGHGDVDGASRSPLATVREQAIRALSLPSAPLSRQRTSQGLTHLRYDTKRFSFRPSEIIASRLRSFVQELDLAPAAGSAAAGGENGERAAASTPAAAAAGAVEEEQDAEDVWPRERSDVWTSTSSGSGLLPLVFPPTNSSSSSSSSATGGGAVVDASSAVFAAEFADSIRHLYGWTQMTQRQRWIASQGEYVDRIEAGFTASDNAALSRIQERFTRQLRDESLLAAAPRATDHDAAAAAAAESDRLRYRARPPCEFVSLGGVTAAFTKQHRIDVFLDRSRGGQGSWPSTT
ncbi:uncharacterized protein PFL1_04347 [Pseudozyma flocculosa PF-1]|uniref:Uncharacterized protein n=1 Tax=Pseudozyma flocculosa PF-1 TaxID=1277687 RepID=A0A061H7Q9_9BASI|nr:uncharacterized protein PFL1_04347 [Pseudozyma flocculosa PF-1]EPQ28020.1 hypothetical protein PFL1_04347 [Pseudozyma flocculosa PF-1]